MVMIKDWYFSEFGKVLTRRKPETSDHESE